MRYWKVPHEDIRKRLDRTNRACRKVLHKYKHEREEYCRDLDAALGLAALHRPDVRPRRRRPAPAEDASVETAPSAPRSSEPVGSSAPAEHVMDNAPQPQQATIDNASPDTASPAPVSSDNVVSAPRARVLLPLDDHPRGVPVQRNPRSALVSSSTPLNVWASLSY